MPTTDGRIYSLDSSALIFAWHEAYPIESFTTFWDRLGTMLTKKRALVSEEVYEEIGRKDDGLHDWMKPHEGLLIPHTDDVQTAVSSLLQTHPLLIKARKGRSGGDPFVIAVAICHKGCVVTQEGEGSIAAPRIPDVCHHYGIGCQPLRDLIREQGWRF